MTGEPVNVPIVVPDKGEIIPEAPKDTATAPIILPDPEEDPKAEDQSGKNFKIAVLLPFSLDEYHPNVQDAATASISRGTKMAVEFFQGFKLAVDDMKQSSVQAEIFVYDTRNDVAATRKILNSPDFPKADLIIGPVFNANLRIAAEYCKEHQIPMISPLSSSSNVTSDNPYYYTSNGTSDSHYEALIHHIKKFYPEDTLRIIHNGTPKEREIIDRYLKISSEEFREEANPVIEIKMTTESNITDLKYEFDSLHNHIVFIPSYDEVFTNFALNQLAQIKTYYPSVVFGMPTWINFANANYDYFEWLQVHVTESTWINEFNIDLANTKRDFTLMYGMEPSEYAYQGYDLAHFVIAFLEKEGRVKRNKEQFFTVDAPYIGLQSNFQFAPRYREGSDKIEYWDNRYIHVLKFENYRFNKVD
jgi:ABC-type branched-subunit amino acid transport system substrate-binding protein